MSDSEEEELKCILGLDDGEFEITEEYITESRPLRQFYRFGWNGPIPAPIKGQSSIIIKKALEFCKKRGEIKNKYKKEILQQKLKVFDDSFFEKNQNDAIDLANVACRLQIRSLYYLMRKAAANMLAEMTPDEIYKHLKVHYDANKTSADELQKMKRVVRYAAWAFK